VPNFEVIILNIIIILYDPLEAVIKQTFFIRCQFAKCQVHMKTLKTKMEV
jgi:hypothetical protein